MARLLTREELEERIKELQEQLRQMTRPEHRTCVNCGILYSNRDDFCYCDFESDRYLE